LQNRKKLQCRGCPEPCITERYYSVMDVLNLALQRAYGVVDVLNLALQRAYGVVDALKLVWQIA